MTINRGFSAVVMISGLVLAPLAADAASAVRPRLPDAVSASQVKRLVGSVAPGIDGVARWMCASGGNSAHPRTLDLEHDVAVEDFAGGAFRLLFGYDPDNGGSDSKGQVRATVRLRKAGESKSTKIASFRGLQNTGSGDALAIVDVNALVQAGDSLLWSFSFKKMAKMLDTACFFMLAAISKTDDSCRDYPDWSTSTYVLPFQPGERSVITQGNCFIGSHRGEAQYAYDFGMPIGTEIVAISSGVVVGVDDTHPDNTGIDGHDNVLTIEDDDGLLARYVHLTQGGALVSVGDVVQQGQVIALSGNSGSTSGIPHLHLQLTSCTDRSVCGTLPMTFRNTSPNPNGLQTGEEYRAKAF